VEGGRVRSKEQGARSKERKLVGLIWARVLIVGLIECLFFVFLFLGCVIDGWWLDRWIEE
jgi:hypothetical protein